MKRVQSDPTSRLTCQMEMLQFQHDMEGLRFVFHMYRQPMDHERVRECLLFLFAANAMLRLVIVVSLGEFSSQALLLSLEAVPVVFAVTWWHAHYPPRIELQRVRQIVCGLLMIAGLALIWSATRRFAA